MLTLYVDSKDISAPIFKRMGDNRVGRSAAVMDENSEQFNAFVDAIEQILFAGSDYGRGYRYGNQGKFPMPAEQSDEWNGGYEDGRADWLNAIRPERKI